MPGCGTGGWWWWGGLWPGSLCWVRWCRVEAARGRIQGLIVCFRGVSVIGSCHYPIRAAVTGPADPPALIAVAFSSRRITRLTAKSCLSISAGGRRLDRPGSAGMIGLSARGDVPASGAFSRHPLPPLSAPESPNLTALLVSEGAPASQSSARHNCRRAGGLWQEINTVLPGAGAGCRPCQRDVCRNWITDAGAIPASRQHCHSCQMSSLRTAVTAGGPGLLLPSNPMQMST